MLKVTTNNYRKTLFIHHLTCLKSSPSVLAILEQYDLPVARSGVKPVLKPGQTRPLSPAAYLEPSVLVLRRSLRARTRWTGLILFITEHIVVRYLYPDCTTDSDLNVARANSRSIAPRWLRALGRVSLEFVKENVKLFCKETRSYVSSKSLTLTSNDPLE